MPAPGPAKRAIGRRPIGFVARSRPPAGRSPTAARTSRSRRPRPRTWRTVARIQYGSSERVPSRLDQPSAGLATVIVLATDWPADLARTLDALQSTSPVGTTLVVVADGPSAEQEAQLVALAPEASGAPGPGDASHRDCLDQRATWPCRCHERRTAPRDRADRHPPRHEHRTDGRHRHPTRAGAGRPDGRDRGRMGDRVRRSAAVRGRAGR